MIKFFLFKRLLALELESVKRKTEAIRSSVLGEGKVPKLKEIFKDREEDQGQVVGNGPKVCPVSHIFPLSSDDEIGSMSLSRMLQEGNSASEAKNKKKRRREKAVKVTEEEYQALVDEITSSTKLQARKHKEGAF